MGRAPAALAVRAMRVSRPGSVRVKLCPFFRRPSARLLKSGTLSVHPTPSRAEILGTSMNPLASQLVAAREARRARTVQDEWAAIKAVVDDVYVATKSAHPAGDGAPGIKMIDGIHGAPGGFTISAGPVPAFSYDPYEAVRRLAPGVPEGAWLAEAEWVFSRIEKLTELEVMWGPDRRTVILSIPCKAAPGSLSAGECPPGAAPPRPASKPLAALPCFSCRCKKRLAMPLRGHRARANNLSAHPYHFGNPTPSVSVPPFGDVACEAACEVACGTGLAAFTFGPHSRQPPTNCQVAATAGTSGEPAASAPPDDDPLAPSSRGDPFVFVGESGKPPSA